MNLRQFFTRSQWWGKLICAFLGYLIGGSAGALFGLLIGNFFDRALMEHFSRPDWHYYSEKQEYVQKTFFEATFSVIGYIAKSDGRVSEQEIKMAKALMDEMRLNRKQKLEAQRLFNEGKKITFDLVDTLNALENACRDNPDLLKLFLDIQYRAAMTDGLSERKIQAVDSVFRRLGYAPLRDQFRFYEDFGFQKASQSSGSQRSYSYNRSRAYQNSGNYQKPQDSLAHAYAILELNQNANKQEVKRAYRRLISRNHPDKLIAQGLPEEMIKKANDKTQKITKAYEQICLSKGW
ncbi:co-chaperone DjlA [Legionella maceachernii]|uniref:Co-chaperone protein DjlA n=1 Tax=Legionella maceachernii TaxID=466 RepID=A0A0W0WFE9_9GAMM|nr:co-chaperone DjlA [Legionella maceachernii]KTD31076.1 DNA binding protein DnaJ, heat shock protein [Legionella maceachernii]SJZ98232.1 DnaJ like chaperone protein [Legionella maceachernii]SUP01138.1 DnaJ-like protein DjlA [Legionella maceachernii]